MPAAQHIRFVREEGPDRIAEVAREPLVIPFVGDSNKFGGCFRVKQIGGGGRVRAPVVRSFVDAPDRSARVRLDKQDDRPVPRIARPECYRSVYRPQCDGRSRIRRLVARLADRLRRDENVIALQHGGQKHRLRTAELGHFQPPAGVFRVARHDKAARRSGRVHRFVVQEDGHAAAGCFFHRRLHQLHIAVGQIRNAFGHPHPGMDDKPHNAFLREAADLPQQLLLRELVVPKPERKRRILVGRRSKLSLRRLFDRSVVHRRPSFPQSLTHCRRRTRFGPQRVDPSGSGRMRGAAYRWPAAAPRQANRQTHRQALRRHPDLPCSRRPPCS